MKRKGVLSLACAAALTVACNGNARTDQTAAANDPNNGAAVGTTGNAAGDSGVHDADQEFIRHHLMGGMAEVQLGKLAAERASNAEVKRFGQMMVTDHTKAGDQLKQVAMRFGVTPPAQLDQEHQQLMDRLSGLRGAEFDREYMKAMVDDHEEDVDALQSRVDSHASATDVLTNQPSRDTNVSPEPGDNAAQTNVNAWAAMTLPTIRHHLDRARTIDDVLGKGRNDTARNRR